MARRSAVKAGDKTAAVAYLRVSTDEQHLGPVAQRAALEAWAAREGVSIVAWCEDLGVSGGATLDRRPGLLAALAALEEHGAGVLIVAKRDRLARDVMVAAMVEAAAARVGARVVSAAGEGTDGAEGDPTGLLMRRLVDAFSEYERALIAARTKAALAVKRGRGEATGGDAPFGTRKEGGRLVRDEAEQEIIAAAREYRAAGLSLRQIAARLEERGLLARGKATWTAGAVSRLLGAA
jgi:site-specific DNA recombinase